MNHTLICHNYTQVHSGAAVEPQLIPHSLAAALALRGGDGSCGISCKASQKQHRCGTVKLLISDLLASLQLVEQGSGSKPQNY